jgi:hypothetical protein
MYRKKGIPQMKKCFYILPLMLLVTNIVRSNDAVGHTYYAIRPQFQAGRPDRVSLWRWDAAKERDCGWCGSLQLTPFGGQSTRPKDLAKYFMFSGNNQLTVAGDTAFGSSNNLLNNPNLRDVNATFFNIPDTFRSTIKFRPRHSFVGAGFAWRQYLGSCCETAQWWFELSTALVNVRHTMQLAEQILTPAGTTVSAVQNGSMTEAFLGQKPTTTSAAKWQFAKIAGGTSTTALDDIELKVLGFDVTVCQTGHLEGYVGAVWPVGKKANGEFVFQAEVGSHSPAVMCGSAFGIDLWCCNDKTVRFELEQNSRYLFKHTQWRTFDVKGKAWSRYMLTYKNLADAQAGVTTEGVNIFTQECKITPRFAHIINAALVAKTCDWQSEVGYNLWSRQSEKVHLKNPWAAPAFVGLGPLTRFPITANTISRAITIKEDFSAANIGLGNVDPQLIYNENSIQESDLDLDSAAHPAVLSQTVYAAFGYQFDECKFPVVLGVGASYEFSGVNTALNQWMVWGKIGISL